MTTEIKVVVQVSGGVVQSIHVTPAAPIVLVVIDYDNEDSVAGRGSRLERIAERETQGLTNVGFETFPEGT